jgi:hypothetical protein
MRLALLLPPFMTHCPSPCGPHRAVWCSTSSLASNAEPSAPSPTRSARQHGRELAADLVASSSGRDRRLLNRPGGNLTGVTILAVELGAKLFEMLHELVPKATVVALLVNRPIPLPRRFREMRRRPVRWGLTSRPRRRSGSTFRLQFWRAQTR